MDFPSRAEGDPSLLATNCICTIASCYHRKEAAGLLIKRASLSTQPLSKNRLYFSNPHPHNRLMVLTFSFFKNLSQGWFLLCRN